MATSRVAVALNEIAEEAVSRDDDDWLGGYVLPDWTAESNVRSRPRRIARLFESVLQRDEVDVTFEKLDDK